jgi:hypothetical protein
LHEFIGSINEELGFSENRVVVPAADGCYHGAISTAHPPVIYPDLRIDLCNYSPASLVSPFSGAYTPRLYYQHTSPQPTHFLISSTTLSQLTLTGDHKMKLFKNRFDAKGVSETSNFNNSGPVPILRNSYSGMACCRSSEAKRADIFPSKKRSLATPFGLNLKILTLAVCIILILFIFGLHGMAGAQETDGGIHVVSHAMTDAEDPFSGTWVLNLSKSKLPSQFSASILKNQVVHVVMDESDIDITQETLFESDRPLSIHVKAKFDGKDYLITGAPGKYSAAYWRVDKNTITVVLKSNGKAIAQETGVVSPDGKSFTIICFITDETGNQTILIPVFEKK